MLLGVIGARRLYLVLSSLVENKALGVCVCTGTTPEIQTAETHTVQEAPDRKG